jgi:hypothetical protein
VLAVVCAVAPVLAFMFLAALWINEALRGPAKRTLLNPL